MTRITAPRLLGNAARRIHPGLAITLLMLLPASAPAELPDVAAQGWVLQEKNDHEGELYRLYRRPVSGSAYDEWRMEVPIAAAPRDVLAALEHNMLDPATYPEKLERKILRREERAIVSHDYIRVPFLSDRDVVVRTEIDRDPATGHHVMRWFSLEGEGPPPADGVVRMPSSRGSWTLHPDDAGGTLAIYQSHVEIGGSLPTSFVEANMPKEITYQARQLWRTMKSRELARR